MGNSYPLKAGLWIQKDIPKVLYPLKGKISTLFNIDNLDYHEPLVVVEGIMGVILIWQHITKNVTCTFGVNIKGRNKKDC